jgi:rhamnosyltransferase
MLKDSAVFIVRYNNNVEVFKGVVEALSELTKVYIYDNSKLKLDGLDVFNKDIYYYHDADNGGLAKAINHLTNVSLNDGKQLAVYFDQDSDININIVKKLFDSYQWAKNKDSNVFVVGPQPTMVGGENYPIRLGGKVFESYYIANEIITSGMTFRPQDIKDIGYFDEDLFLDMVDFDICWRAVEADKIVLVDSNIKMQHEVGENTIKIPFKILPISSPIRNYYQMRNVLYCSLYKNKKSKLTVFYYMLRRLANVSINLLFADEKMLRLKYNARGISDAVNKRMGKLES